MPRKPIIFLILTAFLGTSVQSPAFAQIDPMPFMPQPGAMVHLSPEFTPAMLKGIIIHPEDPFKFDFIIYKGDQPFNDTQKREEYTKLTKYFLASLAIPDNDQWVNLSPYEKDRIIKDDFGKTEMGRDLLAQDYMLKQITASLIYPEDNLGKKFWVKVYAQAQKQYGTTNIPVNTFNKVWILPDNALIYEKGNTAYILRNHLRVMLEEDYLSLQKHAGIKNASVNKAHSIASKIVREIVLPELQREVNEDKNFAPLRQVYSGMLLATWFKRTLKQSLLGRIYANKAKVKGVDQDPKTNKGIYQQYLKAYKKGVFNFIKEDVDKYTNETMPRKYFSGGTGSFDNAAMAFGHDIVKDTKDVILGDKALAGDESQDEIASFAMNAARPQASTATRQEFVTQQGLLTVPIFSPDFIKSERAIAAKQPTIAVDLDDTVASWAKNKEAYIIRPGMAERLQELKDKGYRLVLWTAATRDSVKNTFIEKHPEIARFFDLAITRESFYFSFQEQKQVIQAYKNVSEENVKKIYGDNRDSGFKDFMLLGYKLIIDDKFLDEHEFIQYPQIEEYRKRYMFGGTFTVDSDGEILSSSSTGEEIEGGQLFTSLAEKADERIKAADNKQAQSHPTQDSAMNGMEFKKGGIDLNSANLALLIKRDGKGTVLPFVQQDLAQLSTIQGLEPEILSIIPASQSPVFSKLTSS